MEDDSFIDSFYHKNLENSDYESALSKGYLLIPVNENLCSKFTLSKISSALNNKEYSKNFNKKMHDLISQKLNLAQLLESEQTLSIEESIYLNFYLPLKVKDDDFLF